MDGLTCFKNEKNLPTLDLLKQYRNGLEQLLVAFNATRYATCNRLMANLESLLQQLTSKKDRSGVAQNQSSVASELLRIQELQVAFYDRSREQLNDLIQQAPKRTQLNRLEKFL